MNAKLKPMQRADMTQEAEYFTQEEKEFAEEYSKSLSDLTFNSKPLINVLTMLAEENSAYSKTVTNIIESYLHKVSGEVKLPVLYLIDSIVKNIGSNYIPLFAKNIVETFSCVFREVNEETRGQMYKLRQTWYNIFPNDKLYALDKRIKSTDPGWPITAAPPPTPVVQPVTPPVSNTIHLNPLFLKKKAQARETTEPPVVEKTLSEAQMREELLKKKRGLRMLVREKEKLEELMSKKLSRQEEKLEELKSQLSAAKQQKNPEKSTKRTVAPKETSKPVVVDTTVPDETSSMRRMGPPADSAAAVMTTRIAPVNSALVNAVLSRDPRLAGRQGSPPAIVGSVEQASEDKAVIKTSVKDPRVSKTESDNSERTKKLNKAKSESPKSKKGNSSSRSGRSSPERETRSSRSSKKSPRKSSEHGHSSKRRFPNDSPREKKRVSYLSRPKDKPAILLLDDESNPSDPNDSKEKAPSPPPPPVISDKGKSNWPVNYIKGSQKGRNYVRRDREESPDVAMASAVPPEKQPRLADMISEDDPAVPDKTAAPIVPTTAKCVGLLSGVVALPTSSTEPLKPACQDVDLRLVASPSKKRASAEPEDVVEPPPKKIKAAVMDMLFGDEDVDLRTLPIPMKAAAVPVSGPTVPVVAVNKAPPSPPPPPKISHEPRGTPSPPHRSPRERDSVENQPPFGWAKYKQTRSPMSPHGYLRQRDHHGPQERTPTYSRSPRQNVDRLGRPFLFHRSSEDSSERENSLSSTGILPGEDTDMRQPMMRSVNDAKLHDSISNFKLILSQAAEQMKSGNITSVDYDNYLKEVIRLHESHKIEEAQGYPMNQRPVWERRPHGRDYRHGLGSPTSKDQFGDIDERYPNPSEKRPPLLTLPTKTWNMASDERGRDYDRPIHSIRHSHGMPGPGGPPFMGMMPQRPIRPGMRRMGMRPPVPPWGAGPPPGRNLSWKGFGTGPTGLPGPLRGECHTFPPASEQVLQMIANDTMEETTINGRQVAVRFYGKTAVALMGPHDVPEVRFRDGERAVIFDGPVAVTCAFNQPPREVDLGGKIVWVSLGAPTRELYIDETWYPCNFGGPPIEINLEPGWKTRVQLQGPLPGLQFVRQRTDLIAGIVVLFIDGCKPVQLCLDAKPQRFDIDGVPFCIRFTDALRVISINDEPVNLTFDGPPLRIAVNYKDHFIRLSGLPPGVKPGEVWINSMPGKSGIPPPPPPAQSTPGSGPLLSEPDSSTRTTSAIAAAATPTATPTPVQSSASRPAPTQQPDEPGQDDLEHNPALPMRRTRKMKTTKPEASKQTGISQATSVLPSVLSSLIAPSAGGAASINSYQITDTSASSPVSGEASASTSTTNAGIPFLGSDFNVDDLYQRLVSSGFLKSTLSASTETKKEADAVKKVTFDKPETFKVEQPAIVSMLYSGIQCSSCGVRFPPEQTVKYSQHLDWHFRQNRRDKDSQRKPQSRKWYYDVSDWIQFEEIEDLEERAQSWFETQQSEASRPEEVEPEELESVPAGDCPEGAFCELCHDKFEQFYNEEKEEWHLRHAVQVEDKLYHPVCYKDFKAALEEKDENAVNEDEEEKEDADAKEESPVQTKEDEEMGEGSEEKEDGVEVKEEDDDKTEIKEELNDEGETNVAEVVENGENEITIKTEIPDETDPDASPSRASNVEMAEVGDVKPEVEDAEMKVATELKEDGGEEKTFEEELSQGVVDTTHVNVASNIDGNVEHEDAPQSVVVAPPKIKINITKAIVPAPVEEEESKNAPPEEENRIEDEVPCCAPAPAPTRELDVSSQPPPPGEEPILLKPKLMGRKLVDVPPYSRGAELSGLCSIM